MRCSSRARNRSKRSGMSERHPAIVASVPFGDEPDYATRMPGLAAATREQWPLIQQLIGSLGSLKSITFRSVSPGEADVYNVVFERGRTQSHVPSRQPRSGIMSVISIRECRML